MECLGLLDNLCASCTANVEKARGKAKEICYELLCRVYTEEGYSCPDEDFYKRRSIVFYTHTHNRVSGTISVIVDSAMGLPLDEIFFQELIIMREDMKKIAEVGKFAVDKELVSHALVSYNLIAMDLMCEVFQYSIRNKVDYVCITVNPKHVLFYKKFFGFIAKTKKIRTHPGTKAPAVFLFLDVQKWAVEKQAQFLKRRRRAMLTQLVA